MRRNPQIHQRCETRSANHAELKLMCQTARKGAWSSGALVGRGGLEPPTSALTPAERWSWFRLRTYRCGRL